MDRQLFPSLQSMVFMSGITVREQIASIYNFIDFMGFWTDKPNKKSNLARIYDASHTYFSSGCDFFISNDKRARNKAIVAFNMFKIRTKVLSYMEFVEQSNGA
jgi:hypothetical protein